MSKGRWMRLCPLILLLWLIGPMPAFASGSGSTLPPVTPFNHPALGPGLFFPEPAARVNDAMSEAAISKAALYEQRLGELSMLLDVTAAQLATAKDSLKNLRDLVPRVQKESYRNGFSKGRHGLGAYVGYSLIDNDFAAGFGYVIRF